MHVWTWLFVPLLQQRKVVHHPTPLPRAPTTALGGLLHEFTSADPGKARLDVFLASEFKQHSRSFLSDLCEKGRVTVNGKQQNKNFKVSKGDKVVVDVDVKKDTSTVTPEHIPLDILYEDDHIIAVNKPNGMVVHPAVGSPNGTFVNALLYHLGDKAQSLLDAVGAGVALVDEDDEDDGNSDIEGESSDSDGAEAALVDLPETPEAAQASPQRLRPGIVHRLDKVRAPVSWRRAHDCATQSETSFACCMLTDRAGHVRCVARSQAPRGSDQALGSLRQTRHPQGVPGRVCGAPR